MNAQTDETGETALTLACCGGFLEVASLLIKAGANCEMGANTPLMEAAQEGHVEVVKFLLKQGQLCCEKLIRIVVFLSVLLLFLTVIDEIIFSSRLQRERVNGNW